MVYYPKAVSVIVFNFVKHISAPFSSQIRKNCSTLQWISNLCDSFLQTGWEARVTINPHFYPKSLKNKLCALLGSGCVFFWKLQDLPTTVSSGTYQLQQLWPFGELQFLVLPPWHNFFGPEGCRLVWTLVGMQKIICSLNLSFWFLACWAVCTVIDFWDWLQYGSWYRDVEMVIYK